MLNILQILIFSVTATLSYNDETCSEHNSCSENHNKYSKGTNQWYSNILKEIRSATADYMPCERQNCSCHKVVVDRDLAPFKDGITKEMFSLAQSKATKYQIIGGELYRQKDCHFPARCSGVEHYLKAMAPQLPDMELAINTRDWPQVNHAWGHVKAPVFSFSKVPDPTPTGQLPARTICTVAIKYIGAAKTKDYYDIMYPAWSFWEGGPAIALYPNGIGRWDKHRLSISAAAERWPWSKKEPKGFFRGSRTSEERDALVRLSRDMPNLVDAQYTKNQAWKSKADTLNAEPATEVSFEDHCKYKYLFNYRGVAASFRFKHLFLCKSLVFHVGSEWLEFYYPSLKPWVHYVPLSPYATQAEIAKHIEFFQENDSLAQEIAERGYQFIWENLTSKDVKCYWRHLLKKYIKLIKYNVVRDEDLIKII